MTEAEWAGSGGQAQAATAQMPSFDQQVEEALQAVETGVADATFDYPDVHVDDLYHEIAGSVAAMYPAPVAREIKRRLGF